MGILHHSDGDYLYVGSNRDIAYLVMAGLFRTIKDTTDYATINGYIETFFDGDIVAYPTQAEVDLHPRIFRLKLNATDTSWELIYTSPNVTWIHKSHSNWAIGACRCSPIPPGKRPFMW